MGAETRVALGKLLTGQGALDDAERELKDALGKVEGEPLLIMVEAAAHEALAELYEPRGQLAEAVAHHRRARALRERIARRDARNKAAQIEVRAAMETARKDAELHKKDAELHRLRFVELHEMQSKLVEAEKMALLGRLAAGAAHELNTPLGVLRSNAAQTATATRRLVALVQQQDDGARAERLAGVLESCHRTSDEALERIAAIAGTLRRFTLLDQAERRAFDVREGLQSALALLRPTIPAAIALERRLDEVPAIVGWPRELNHAFLTVLQNAAEAIDGAGTIIVETGVETGVEAGVEAGVETGVETGAGPTGEQVLVRIRDTGRGMSKEQVAHLFDVTWSEAGARTKMRLGLAAAYATVQKHDGALEVESAPGRGTVVTFRLPLPRP
jgi:two-component system NtrC family sensor kinase